MVARTVYLGLVGTYGSVNIAAGGAWIYTLDNADPDTHALAQGASASDVFTYTMQDSNGATSTSTLTVAITGTNDAPNLGIPIDSAVVDKGQVLSNVTLSFSNLGSGANFQDPDTSDTLEYSFTSGPNWLTVTSAGEISGTVPTTASGTYTATLTATDPYKATASSTFSLIVANNSGTRTLCSKRTKSPGLCIVSRFQELYIEKVSVSFFFLLG